MANKVLSRLKNHIVYRWKSEWRSNIYAENDREKVMRWKQFISDSDRDSVRTIEEKVQELLEQNSKYTLSLVAHGSSTYGKTGYSDVDLILEPSNGRIQMYDELWESLRSNFDIFFDGGFCLNKDWVLEFNLAHLFDKQRRGKPIQIGYRTNIYREEYAEPLSGEELLVTLRRMKKPHVALFLDNQRIS